MMKAADYFMKRLEEHGVTQMFLLSGGGMMHLLDSVARSGIAYYCNLHEQACGIGAEAYAMSTGKLGVCMTTGGPGATNLVTSIASAYIDSEPVLYITGQAKTSDLVGERGVRQIGAQEVNIVAITAPITKYAVTIMNAQDAKYHIDKAIYLATHGRKGSVLLDVPLDIQAQQVDEAGLREFDPAAEGLEETRTADPATVRRIASLLKAAERPVFLIGHGIIASGAEARMRLLARAMGVPVLASWRAKMVFSDFDELYFGTPGTPGPRYSNFILQTCDCLIAIGTRLNPALTAFNEAHFAPYAKRVIVDIDQNEIARMRIDFTERLVSDAGEFADALYELVKRDAPLQIEGWRDYCGRVKEAYPVYKEKQAVTSERVNPLLLAHKLSDYTCGEDVIVGGSSGRSSGSIGMGFRRKEGQIQIMSMGMGSMGYALPAAIGACIATGKRRTITMDGDGSLQHNLQELALIKGYHLPIKLFVMNNGGYASIMVMQDNHYKSRYAACNPKTGVYPCGMKKLAELYSLDYHIIRNDDEIDAVLTKIMADDRPVLCELLVDYTFDEIPKAVSTLNADGTISSSELETLFPYIPAEETRKWMSIVK